MEHKKPGRITPIVEERGKLMFNVWVRSSGGKKGGTAANHRKRSESRFAALAEQGEDEESPNAGLSRRGEIF